MPEKHTEMLPYSWGDEYRLTNDWAFWTLIYFVIVILMVLL